MPPTHGTLSRLDYFLISHKAVPLVQDSRILEESISDHSPVLLSLQIGLARPGRKPWRMNIQRYKTPEGKTQLCTHLNNYLSSNKGTVTSDRIIWTTAKATIGVQLMRDAAQANKQNAVRQRELEQDIVTFTRLYTKKPTLEHRKSLEQARMALNGLFTSKAEYALYRMKGRHYEQGEKAGRLLAAQLRQREAAMAIPALRSSGGDVLTHPQDIVNEFASYYKHLYTPSDQIDQHKITSFLAGLELPRLSDDRQLLDRGISKEEISQAIAKLPYYKAPGEDGFPAEFYHWSGENIIDSLHAAFQEAEHESSLGSLSNRAIIAVLPKPGKDPLLCSSYRPISLLNCDVKIHTKTRSTYAPNILLIGLPLLSGVLSTRRIQLWKDNGIHDVSDLFEDGILINHDTFMTKHGVPNTLFLTHAHISNYIKKTWVPAGHEPATNEFVHMQYLMGNGGHLVRWLYKGMRLAAGTLLHSLREKWTVELGKELTDKEWEGMLEYPRKTSRNPKFKLIQLMMVHRAYLTPYKINKMFPEASDCCPRCQAPQAQLLHMIWDCPKLANYWCEVHKLLGNIVTHNNMNTPEYSILGVGLTGKNKKGPGCKFMNLALLLAK